MIYEMPIDLYKDWKDLTYSKLLFQNIVEELKKANQQGKENGENE